MSGNIKMRNIYAILLMISLTGSIALSSLTSVVNINYALIDPPSRIYLDPSDNVFYSNVTSVGHRFNVTIWVENTPDIGGAQVYMEFDDDIINVTRWYEPKTDTQYIFYGKTTSALPTPPDPGYLHIAPGKARVLLSVSLFPPPPDQPPSNGTGKICIFEFKITAVPPESSQFTCPLHINITDTYLLDPDGNEVLDVIKEDGTYTFFYASPPLAAPHIWLEASPSTYDAIKPRPFNVTVTVKNVSLSDGLIGIQFEVKYNSTYLEATDIIPGDFLSNITWAPYGTFSSPYIEEGRAMYGEIILPNAAGEWNPPYPEGNGTVATITFLPLLHKRVESNITIEPEPLFGEFFLDKDGIYIPYAPAKGTQYTYSPLPLPTLAITPSKYTASHVGETFDVNVTLNNLDAQWDMTYAEFKLWYDNNSLQVLNVVEGDFLSQFGDTTFNHTEVDGCIKMNITLTPTTYPYGSGTLATITFNVTTSPGISKLSLNDTKLLDFEMKEVLHEVQHGYYQLHEILVHPIVWNTETFDIVTVSNTSVTPVPMLFDQLHRLLYFNVTGYTSTIGFVNITIPRDLLYSSPSDWFVIVNGEKVEVTVVENATHVSLYFTFSLSSTSVYILGTSVIPEMSPNILILVLLAATLMGLAVAKKARLKKREELVHCKTPCTRL